MSSLKKMKKEIDFLDEHYLHDILHEFYDDEKYYFVEHTDNLKIQDHNSVPFPSLDKFNVMFKSNMICKLVYGNPLYFEIYRLIFNSPRVESKLYKRIITNTPHATQFTFQISNNLLYFAYIEDKEINLEIVDLHTSTSVGKSWKMDFLNYDGSINQILFSGNKIILDSTHYIYIINRDGSYNMITNT
jgi:hypothetical protein